MLKEYFLQLNHLFKSRDLVTKNDAEVAKPQVHTKDEIPNSVGFRDRGFTSPKVANVILC